MNITSGNVIPSHPTYAKDSSEITMREDTVTEVGIKAWEHTVKDLERRLKKGKRHD